MRGDTVIIADDAVDRCGGAVGLAESDVLRHALLPPAADVPNERVNARIVRLSEVFLLLSVNDALLDTHLIQLLEVSLGILRSALRMQLPR